LERRRDPETKRRHVLDNHLRLKKRSQLICASTMPRISSALFLSVFPRRISWEKKIVRSTDRRHCCQLALGIDNNL